MFLLPAGDPAGQQPGRERRDGGRVVLGVLRSDGFLLPFAAYDGDDWSTPWPGAIGQRNVGAPGELPANLEAIPRRWWGGEPPQGWRLWARGAGEGQPFTLLAPVMLPVGAERRLALRTDYRASMVPVPPFELPYPKAGLAVAGDVPVADIPSVNPGDPAAREMLDGVRAEMEQAEDRAIGLIRSNAGWSHPLDRGTRRKFVPLLEAVYSTPLDDAGSTVAYIEAVKKYPPGPEDQGCGLETFITGWVHRVKGERRSRTNLRATVTYCDRQTASYMLPLGLLRLRDRLHWVFQLSGQDHEWYVVAETRPGRTRYLAEYHAGGLPRP